MSLTWEAWREAHEGHRQETGDMDGWWCTDCTDRLDWDGAQPGTYVVVDYPCPPLLARLGIAVQDRSQAERMYLGLKDVVELNFGPGVPA